MGVTSFVIRLLNTDFYNFNGLYKLKLNQSACHVVEEMDIFRFTPIQVTSRLPLNIVVINNIEVFS